MFYLNKVCLFSSFLKKIIFLRVRCSIFIFSLALMMILFLTQLLKTFNSISYYFLSKKNYYY